MKRHVKFVRVARHGRSSTIVDAAHIYGMCKLIMRYTKTAANIAEQIATNPKAEKRIPYLLGRAAIFEQQARVVHRELNKFCDQLRKEMLPSVVSIAVRVRKRKPTRYAPGSYDLTRPDFRFQKICIEAAAAGEKLRNAILEINQHLTPENGPEDLLTK